MAPAIPTATEPAAPLVIWRVSDGRAGHDSQSLGLVEALGRCTPCRSHELRAGRGLARLRAPAAPTGPRPDLIIAAGHGTHPGVMALRRAHGGRSVILMQPSLPLRCFDLCLVPAHDAPRARSPRLEITRGALCRNRPGEKQPGTALVLVGGPSRHFHWHGDTVLAAIRAILDSGRHATVTVADSPRTPPALRAALARLPARYIAFEQCPGGWLAAELAITEAAWVTRDSVSMVYEALSSGCRLGLIDVPPRRTRSRLLRATELLLEAGEAIALPAWQAGAALPAASGAWAEADRCARLILQRWFPDTLPA